MKKIEHIAKRFIFFLSISLFSLPACALQPLTVILDWFPNPDHAPLFVAKQQGFFKKVGLEVELIGPANPTDPPKLVAAGKADVAITYQPQLLLAVQQGLPLVRIGTLIDQPLGCVIVNAKQGINTMADFNHKIIGYSDATIDTAMLNVMLQTAHLTTNNVTMINVNYDLTQALMTNRVDAITGVMRNFEAIQLQLAKFPARIFYPEQYGVPSYDELVFVANRNKINDKNLVAFLSAVQQGEHYLQQHPETTWKVFARNHPELNNEFNKHAWFATLPYFAKNPFIFDKNRYDKFENFMQQQGLLHEKLSVKQYAVMLH